MRTLADRIRHVIAYEIIAMLVVVPVGSAVFGTQMLDMGVVGIVGATIATLWNFAFNYVFDLGMQQACGITEKRGLQRLLHGVLFEGGLTLILLPFLSWYLGITVLQALAMHISFAIFYFGYTLVFNWAYDRVFPLPEWQEANA